MMVRVFPVILLIAVSCLLACDAGDLELVGPERATNATPALTIHAVVGEPYTDLASALGWEGGIPNAQVRVHKTLEPYDEEYWTTAETDAVGVAEFPDLLAGLYEVEVTRTLTSDEAAQARTDARVVAGGKWLQVPRSATWEVEAVPNQQSGLVFSEVAIVSPLPWEAYYFAGGYLELFNNSSTTVFLDGMILGLAWDFYRESKGWNCTWSKPFRTDPEGVWSNIFFQFPGSGFDFPVAPGTSVLVAKSAVDHRPIHWTLDDLSNADFEFGSGGSAGNPDVPDLVEMGPLGIRSHQPLITDPLFLAKPVDLESLPRMQESLSGYFYLRFPRESIVDVTLAMPDFTKSAHVSRDFCSMALHPNFEMLPGPALWEFSDGPAWTSQRRVISAEGGRKVLQDTNTSMADFVRAWKTPGWIPDTLTGGG